MKQYAIYFEGTPIEHTGYFESVAKVRKYLKQRYGAQPGVSFRAVYPTVEGKFYSL